MAEDLADIRAGDAASVALDTGEETLPVDLVRRLSGGESPLLVWREYRGLSVQALAFAAGVEEAMIRRLEGGATPVPSELRPMLAHGLGIDAEDLDSWGQD